jgi:hypothetical protein
MKSAETLENLIAEAVKKGIKSALAEGKGKSTDKSEKHDRVGKKHQKGAADKKDAKKEIKDAKKITRSQLAEGVRKALRMALKEVGMPGSSMPAPGVGASSTMPPTQEEGLSDGDVTKRGKGTFGQIPSPEELQSALNDQGHFDMELQGADGLAFDYAVEVTQVGHPNIQTGEGLHKVLMALMQAPSPEEITSSMSDEELDDPHSQLNRIIHSWEVRYGRTGQKIEKHARSLASSILDSLGWEWV